MTAIVKQVAKLSSGFDCPLVGYGTFQAKNADQLKTAIKAAIQAGYRHIDTAFSYSNEHIIGEALQELYDAGVVKREDLFLTTKYYATKREQFPDVLRNQLAKLRTSYVDLYLIHFPVGIKMGELKPGQLIPFTAEGKVDIDLSVRIEDAWAGMEDCVKLGLARSIGVSNFNISQVERLLKSGTIKPAMNQVESHPGFQNTKLVEFCQKNNVGVTAYSQFGSPGTVTTASGKKLVDLDLLNDERLKAIADKHGKNTAQVILRWQLQRGVFTIPKSVTPERIVANADVFDFELSADDMKAIAAIDLNSRFIYFELPGFKDHPDWPHVEASSC